MQSFGRFSLQYDFSCGKFDILTALILKMKMFWVKVWSSSRRHTTTQHTTLHSRRKESIFDDVYIPCNSPMHTNFTTNWFHMFLYLLNYTKFLVVSAICFGHLQGVRSHKTLNTYSYIDGFNSDNHCILITLYFIYVYILQIIYKKLPYKLYT